MSNINLIDCNEALASIEGAKRVVTAMAAAEPQEFFKALSLDPKPLRGATVYCANPSKAYECFLDPACGMAFVVMFLTAPVRAHQGHGHLHYAPQHLSQWVDHLFALGEVDVFWGSCTPPDERGFVSLGPSACYETETRRRAKKVILEINPELPLTFGDTHVPVHEVDAFIESPHPLPTIPACSSSAAEEAIGNYIGELVPDGATLQLGIGGIPNAVAKALRAKKHLGVHTEMINDAMMELAKLGVIDGSKKTLWPGKMVGGFAYGSAELYRFIDKNPIIELQPASVVNDPYRIGRNERMISINTAVEIDITGQVCSESVGHKELSGVGGAFETHIGAQRSPGGRGIVALSSRNKKGESKITTALRAGAKVSISRNDIDTVVTEYGVARLKGLCVKERALQLIQIAAPEFRDALTHEARQNAYI